MVHVTDIAATNYWGQNKYQGSGISLIRPYLCFNYNVFMRGLENRRQKDEEHNFLLLLSATILGLEIQNISGHVFL